MAQSKTPAEEPRQVQPEQGEPHLPDRAEEAHNLAVEALDEIKHGNKEEGKFLLDEAKQLDPKAAEEVIRAGSC